jgi:hypothetical protein
MQDVMPSLNEARCEKLNTTSPFDALREAVMPPESLHVWASLQLGAAVYIQTEWRSQGGFENPRAALLVTVGLTKRVAKTAVATARAAQVSA